MNLVFDSQIDGEFTGFNGDTVFRFMNGQVWQQSTYHYEYHYAYCPKASIYHNANGSYQLQVDGMHSRVDVVQIQVVTEGIIVSNFNGFALNNTFKFQNGQIWKQIGQNIFTIMSLGLTLWFRRCRRKRVVGGRNG